MNKFAIVFLTAAMTLGSSAVMAASSTGNENSAADAGAAAGGAKENLPPNNVDNSKINTDGNNNAANPGNGKMSADQIDKNSNCKDGKCPDVNKKVGTKQGGGSVDRQTDGTTQ